MRRWQRVFKVSVGAVIAMVLMAIAFPWQNPPPQVEAIFGLGAIGTVVSGVVLLRARRHR